MLSVSGTMCSRSIHLATQPLCVCVYIYVDVNVNECESISNRMFLSNDASTDRVMTKGLPQEASIKPDVVENVSLVFSYVTYFLFLRTSTKRIMFHFNNYKYFDLVWCKQPPRQVEHLWFQSVSQIHCNCTCRPCSSPVFSPFPFPSLALFFPRSFLNLHLMLIVHLQTIIATTTTTHSLTEITTLYS